MGFWSKLKAVFRGETATEAGTEPIIVVPFPPPPEPPPPPPPPPPEPLPPEPAPPIPEEPVLPVLRSLELEEAIAASPEELQHYLVYADWLQERGDPRGELIAIHHRMRQATTPAELDTLRERDSELLDKHRKHLLGPAHAPGVDATFFVGFIDLVELWGDRLLDDLRAILTSDDPAVRFLRTIVVPSYHLDDARQLAAEHAPHLAIVEERTFDPRRVETVRVEVVLADGELHVTFNHYDLAQGAGEYSYMCRAQLGDVRWFHGSGSALTEEQVGDDPPRAGSLPLDALDEPSELSLELRYRSPSHDDDRPTPTVHLAGRATIPPNPTTPFTMLVRPCAPLVGLPFDHSPTTAARPERGPTLSTILNDRGCAIPGVGVYLPDSNELATAGGVVGVASFTPAGDVYLRHSFGSTSGTIALVHAVRRASTEMITFARPPAPDRHHVQVGGAILCASFDPTGELFVAIVYRDTAISVCVFDVAAARLVTTVPAPPSKELTYTLAFHDGQVVAIGDREGVVVDLSTMAATQRSIPRANGFGWRQYGRGLAKYHPACDRTAWMMCAEHADPTIGAPASTIIAWVDGDRRQDAVVIPDEGWAGDAVFGNVTVLPDGRILALGTRIWLAAADGSSVLDLGDVGNYPSHPLIVDNRLYSHGVGPWWTQLPALQAPVEGSTPRTPAAPRTS